MTTTTTKLPLQPVDYVKWVATVIQLIGYGLTGLNQTPWNIYAFLVGIGLWFAVGVMWKDRAIDRPCGRFHLADCRFSERLRIICALTI